MTKSEFVFKMQEEVSKKVQDGFKIEVETKKEMTLLNFIPDNNLNMYFSISMDQYYKEFKKFTDDITISKDDVEDVIEEMPNVFIDKFKKTLEMVNQIIQNNNLDEEQEDEIELD